MSISAIDFYAGIGGTTSGAAAAGVEVRLAANHSPRAVATHSANHPDVDHYCGDIQALDLRRLPRADMLLASPICTEVSPAGGRRARGSQMDLYEEEGHVRSEDFERTRVTFWEVIRATELHRYKAVIIENVVEAARWELFDKWLECMDLLGYNHQFVSVSAAHVGGDDNAPAPQWRDRLYIVFTRHGIRLPDVAPRPLAWCEACGEDVHAVQWWKKNGRRIGKYGPQYLYVCPESHVGIAGESVSIDVGEGELDLGDLTGAVPPSRIVEPYVAPAIGAIDWTDIGTRIGDRESLGMRPLGAATMKRIEYGVRMIGDPALVAAGGNAWDKASAATATGKGKTKLPVSYVRAWPLAASPTPAQVTAIQNGIAMSEPFVTMLRNHGRPTRAGEPLATFSTARHHGLTIPPGAFIAKHYGGRLKHEHAVKSVGDPLPAAVAQGAPTLVIPYRKGSKPYHAHSGPVSTVATRDQHGVLTAETYEPVAVEDCYFRMLKPREAANAQRFAPDYILTGNKSEQQLGAGNANPVNVAQWLAGQVAEALQ